MTFVPTARDWADVDQFEWHIKRNPDKLIKCECFSREEAQWLKKQLRARGYAGRFYVSWLVFPERLRRTRSTAGGGT